MYADFGAWPFRLFHCLNHPKLTKVNSLQTKLCQKKAFLEIWQESQYEYYRLHHCGRLRDLRKPTFLRSTLRASRVNKPS